MTWSIVAKDARTGAFAVAVTSRFFAVGAVCPFGMSHVGAVATQAFVNIDNGPRAVRMMEDQIAPAHIAAALAATDEGRDHRQLHMIDAAGRIGVHNGARILDWAGQVQADNVSVAGNMLAGRQVIERTLETYLARLEMPFVDRLLDALDAGEAAGGDKRGRQSAALRIWTTERYPWLDIRCDDHSEPLVELRRLYAVAQERFLHLAEVLPTRANPSGAVERSHIDRRIAELEEQRIARGEPSASHAWVR
jgi:uncharacterized Ntn-hydrolase superfamily protein